MCVCYAYMHLCKYVCRLCIYASMYVIMYVCVCVCYVYMHLCMYVCEYIYI